ncbi:hypothetical protein GCM10027294_52920 [Marinactinospora endophytica]
MDAMTDTPPAATPLPRRSRAWALLASAGQEPDQRDKAGLVELVRRSALRSGIVGAGLVLAVVAGAPLAARVWAGVWSLPQAGRLALVALGLAVAATAALWRTPLRLRERLGRARLGSLIVAAWAVVIAVVALIVAGTWWVMDTPPPRFPDQLGPRALDAIATRAFAVVAGLGAAALLVISYRRQRTNEEEVELAKADDARAQLAAAREDTRLFTDRFDTASEKLGSEHAAVRLAGVHALAHLADDASTRELRQMCIDVLCAYLRMPYEPEPAPLDENATEEQVEAHRAATLAFAGFREVRHTIIRIIGARLREDTPWRGCDFDFTGTVFDGGDLSRAHFTGGTVSFGDAEFTGGRVDFFGAEFTGSRVSFRGAKFTGSRVSFGDAEFTGGRVDFFGAEFTGSRVSFRGAKFTGSMVFFGAAKFTGGRVDFIGAKFTGSRVSFDAAKFTGSRVSFGAEFSGGTVSFSWAEFTGGRVSFGAAEFTGSMVDFGDAEFSGGTVDFAGSPNGKPPLRPASGRPPVGLVKAVAAGKPGVVRLPLAWEPAGPIEE